MSFAHPLALLLLLLVIPVALLYWLRPRVPRVMVGTGLFWQKALAEEPFRARWQRWRTPVSLVLHSLTVVLLALAAAGPEIPPPQRIVLILDNSATMRATDMRGTRFEAAKETAQRIIESLHWCDEMAIVATNPAPRELQPFTGNRTLLQAAINSVHADDRPPVIRWAVKVAREINASRNAAARVMLITDATDYEAASEAKRSGLEVVRVGGTAGNRAVTRFNARRSNVDPAVCQVFIEVRNLSDQSQQATPDFSIDGKEMEPWSPFTMEKNGRWQHLFEVRLPTSARLTVRIWPDDAYPFDDAAELTVPAPPVREIAGRLGARGASAVDIRVPTDIGIDASKVQCEPPWPPLWIPLAAAAAALLVLEWCLYLRRWTS